jgi:hypothetical protein
VSEYTNGWRPLPGVKEDMRIVQDVLTSHGFTVTVVENPRDRVTLEEAFHTFIYQYGQEPENRLVFYFAGHGTTLNLSTGVKMGYVVPANAPKPGQDKQHFLEQALDMQMIEVYARRIQSKHALFVFDSCFSSLVFRPLERGEANPAITGKTSSPVRQIITSGRENESVPDESIFRKQFIEALRGQGDMNDDDYITGTELGEFLYTTVTNYSKGTQHPQSGKIRDPDLDKGDFVFKLLEPRTVLTPLPPTIPSENSLSFSDPTAKKSMNKGTMIALGVGAAAALGGGVALALKEEKPDPTPTPIPQFAGTFKTTFTDHYSWGDVDSEDIIYLTQNGTSLTGTYEANKTYIDCCSLKIVTSLIGRVTGVTSAKLSRPFGEEICFGQNGCGFTHKEFSTTDRTALLRSNGMVLEWWGYDYYRQ